METTSLVPKRTALWISLAAILAYWIREFLTRNSGAIIPGTFRALVLQVVVVKLVVFAAIYLLLRLGGERFGDIGVTRDRWPKHLGIGLLIGLAMFIGINFLLTSVMNSLIPPVPSTGPSITTYFRNPTNLLAFLPIGIFGGGVVEELERIFVLTRFEKWLGKPGLILGVVLSSVIFGMGHLYQGLGAAISVAVSGVVFALVYLRRRSALEPITAHAFSDVIAMVAATVLAR